MWVEIEFTAIEQDGDSVMVEVPEPSGGRFNLLDLAVETLGHGIGDPVFQVG